jgi:hypothetical protein
LISHQTTPNNSGEEEAVNYDSTASTPIADRGKVIKKFAQTEKKASKSKTKLILDNQTKSTPPVLNLSKGKGLLDDLQYNKIKKKLFLKPEEDDDHDFYLNYQPWTPVGCDGLFGDFDIPEVSYIIYKL